jgi:RnfABCDGE-type electron transport complex B subunit
MTTILLGIAAVGGIALVCGTALAIAARFLAVEEDPRIEQVCRLLPGTNCGGCSLAGCAEYARELVAGAAKVDRCGPGGAAVAEKVAAFFGREPAAVAETMTALVLCGGDTEKAPRKCAYNGIADCAAAASVGGGDKLCRYGCLGYGTCARACPAGAIEITPKSLAVVHPELCIGCGLCVKACPRRIIRMVPVARRIHVLCSSKDKGPVVKKACKVGCIACTVCAKLAENQAIRMEGALAVVDYSKPLENETLVEKCPGHCIVKHEGPAEPSGRRDPT